MAISVVHQGAWQSAQAMGGQMPVPGVVQEGDLMLQVTIGNVHHFNPEGFSTLVEDADNIGSFTNDDYGVQVAYRWADSGLGSSVYWPGEFDGYAALAVIRGAGSIGNTRSGFSQINVASGGLGFVAVADDTVDHFSGMDYWSPDQDINGPGLWDKEAAWGYALAPAGGGTVGQGRRNDLETIIEVLTPPGPSAPTILSPDDGEQIADTGQVEFSWLHNSNRVGGYQDA